MEGHAAAHTVASGGVWTHALALLPGPVLAGAGLVAAATVTGGLLARGGPGRREIWFGATAGALLSIAGLHLLPDAWADASTARMWPGLVPAAAIGAFTVAGLAARAGCGCREHAGRATGAGTAAALAAHRFLEGSAIALAGSTAVAMALAVHALGEGLAAGSLLAAQPRRLAGWLAVMSVSPVIGAAVTGVFPVLAAARTVLPALAAGILVQAARLSLRAAFHGLRTSRLLLSSPAAATTMAATVTALAVHAAG
jgi:zinc transporter ZupT